MEIKIKLKNKLLPSPLPTVVPPPREIKVMQCEATQLRLQWSKAAGIDNVPQRFLVTCSSPGSEPQAIHTEPSCRTLTDLQPETQYTVGVCTVLSNGERSEPASVTIYTSTLVVVCVCSVCVCVVYVCIVCACYFNIWFQVATD